MQIQNIEKGGPGLIEIGIDLERFAIFGNRLVEPAEHAKRIAEEKSVPAVAVGLAGEAVWVNSNAWRYMAIDCSGWLSSR